MTKSSANNKIINMKNIHILPTDKPSKLYFYKKDKNLYIYKELIDVKEIRSDCNNQNIYITSDEEIKEGDWVTNGLTIMIANLDGQPTMDDYHPWKKIILTTDQDLIKDGVQAIDDEFLEWFVKNPSCEFVEVKTKITKDGVWTDLKGYVELPTIHSINYKIIIPQEELHSMDDEVECNNCGNIMSLTEDETIYVCYNSECTSCYEPYEEEEPKQKTLEEAAKKYDGENAHSGRTSFIAGAKWQAGKMYSDEEVIEILNHHTSYLESFIYQYIDRNDIEENEEWFEQFKKKD